MPRTGASKPFAPATPQSSLAARPDTEADTLTLPDGRQVPNDLLALLHRPSTVARLVMAGIETSRELLRLSEHGRQMAPRTGEPLWLTVQDLLDEHQPGVKLGCLAPTAQPQAQGPPRSQSLTSPAAQTVESNPFFRLLETTCPSPTPNVYSRSAPSRRVG